MMIKRIGIIGWYNKLNFGDDLLAHAFRRLLPEFHLTFFGYMPELKVMNTFDYLIIGGGSILPRHPFLQNYHLFRRFLHPSFSIVGVSTKNLSYDENAISSVFEDANLIIMRDYYSCEFFNNHYKCQVAPDLTWLTPQNLNENKVNKKIVGLNMRSLTEGTVYDDIVKVVRQYSKEIVGIPFFTGHPMWDNGGKSDQEILNASGVSAPLEPNIHVYQKLNILIGMRFHSLVLAAQAGIPFIGFDYHPKITAFFNEMGMADYLVPVDNLKALVDVLARLDRNYNQIRKDLLAKRKINIRLATEKYHLLKKDIIRVKKGESIRSRLRLKTRIREFRERLQSKENQY